MPFHRDRDDQAEPAEIIDDLPVTGAGGPELTVAEGSSVFVDDRDAMGVFVGVYPPVDVVFVLVCVVGDHR
ncbi:hypothetical protein ACFYSW_29630 [Rhodococcus aetherivorans]|uniref:hypothetical protein n=1 Tax=Rhodococcus aetherivorans TaxID=191292 RepID=UPI0036A6821D